MHDPPIPSELLDLFGGAAIFRPVNNFSVQKRMAARVCIQGFAGLVIGVGLALVMGAARPAWGATSPAYRSGQSYFGRSNYVEYLPGTLPIIISAPHGGTLTPGEIPNRVRTAANRDFVTSLDGGTRELTMRIREAFRSYFGAYPHVIICHLRRTKVDCNRSLEEGAGGNALAARAWNDFQGFITIASNTVAASSGTGFYIDIHGHGHPVKRLELGYLIRGSQLTNNDVVLDQPEFAAQSSLRGLAARSRAPLSELVRGPRSLGALLAERGFPAIPSPQMPSPGKGTNHTEYPGDANAYFNGGHNTRAHTSAFSGGPIDGVQIETNYRGVRDNEVSRARFGRALARAMEVFFRERYGRSLKDQAPPFRSPKGLDVARPD